MVDKKRGETDPANVIEEQEIHNEDFQFALKALLDAYKPTLEEDLKRAEDPERLKKEALEKPLSCEDELKQAERIFENFFTEDVASRLLSEEGRQQLGPAEKWRWCLLHIRCCIIFGWLVCRRPRTFRTFVYYLYRYWVCVRRVLGSPVSDPPTQEERQDFQTLVNAAAEAYKPFLNDQLTTVEFPIGLPDEVISGDIDCLEGEEDTAAIFERMLTMESVSALMGKNAFAEHGKDPILWFCRCYCLCAIRFGCCLAGARNFIEVLRCLVYFRRCLVECFKPLVCDIIKPAMNACAEEQYYPGPGILGIEIVGSATGAFCNHYVLEWKAAGAPDTSYTSTGIVYPGGSPGPGACGVVNSTLGYLTLTATPVPDNVTVRLCAIATTGAKCCDTVDFQVFRQRVWITSVEGVPAESPPGVLDPNAQLKSGGEVRSFGTALRIDGRAWVGKCAGREIKRYTLSYQPGLLVDPLAGPWAQFWQVDYITPLQKKEIPNNEFDLTSYWRYSPIYLGSPPCATPSPPNCGFNKDWLTPTRWWSGRRDPSTPIPPQSFPVDPEVAGNWTAQQLPLLVNCQSGRYTLRLDVEDTAGNHYYDLQQIWFDNKRLHGEITQVFGVPACDSINLSQFAPIGNDCNVTWLADLLGIAYDEYIEEGNFSVPSDNFDNYKLWIRKDSGPYYPIPIPGPGSPPWGPPYDGTSRVGDPGERCASASPPPGVIPPKTPGILATLDMRRLDAVCNPGEPQLTLKRGECCGYIIRLRVQDKSICPSLGAGRHRKWDHFPICICNDLQGVV